MFVDGVRRLEARTWIEEAQPLGRTSEAGIFASYAAGAVRCDGRAEIVDVQVGRGLYSPAVRLHDVTTSAGCFVAHRTVDATPESLMYAVHSDMADAEVRIAETARRRGDELLLLDGPLRKRAHVPDAVGIVKTHHVRYLPPDLDRVVDALQPRRPHAGVPRRRATVQPLLVVRTAARARRAAPGRASSAARQPARSRPKLSLASPIASTAALGPFASEPHKDARAPQNLYPIGGLERVLRHRLGDPGVLYRALRRASTMLPA